MTIAAAWVRTLKDCRELVVVSDSRLNGGKKMDCGQKILALPRSDAFICFAGDTSWAYPLMHQVVAAVSTYQRSASRAQDIAQVKSHVLKVFEGLRLAVHDASGNEGIPSAEFLFGGYSWIRKKFMIWRIHFHTPRQKNGRKKDSKERKVSGQAGRFEATPATEWRKNPWVFAGDKEHVEYARKKLASLLRSRNRAPHQVEKFKFEWEPFEVIRDMLREVDSSGTKHKEGSIGGAPQVLKLYEHLSSMYLGVEWNIQRQVDGKGVYVCGRKVLGYESPTLWILNPDTLVTRHPLYSGRGKSLPVEGGIVEKQA